MPCSGFATDEYAFFALGTPLEPGIEAEIERHLVFDCETCLAAIRVAHALWYAVASGAPAVEPPWPLRERAIGMVR